MQDLNLQLFNNQIQGGIEFEGKFMDAFADFNQEFLWKFEGISLICLKLEKAKAISIVKKLWSQYAFIFYKTLTSGSKRESISVLYALIQMGNLSAVIANDLIQNFNFNLKFKTCWTISRKKCTKMEYPFEEYIKEYDTRSLFILFICTLLRKSEVYARQQFTIQGKGLIGQVFPGLDKDTEYIQKVFLETLWKYVVDPDGIQKNTKISLLQVRNLDKIALLNKSFALGFLKNVCTRPGVGVCYEDMGWYPPDKEKVKIYNKILSDFIPGLKVLKIEGHKELLLEILRNCPELVKGYVSKLHILPIDQFLHPDWENSVKILTNIVNLPIPQHFGALMELPPPVSGFIDSILPSCFTSNVGTKGLQHSNGLVKLKIAEFLCIALSKLDKVVKELLARSDSYSGNEWSETADDLFEQVQKRIPTWQLIVSFHHSCISDEMENHLELKRLAYRLILLYQKFFSKTIQESNFNYGKLILANMYNLPSDIQYLFLEIMGNVKEFKWWMVSDNGGSHFKKLLSYFVSCKNKEIKEYALESLVSCTSKSTLFHENSDYLYILLSVLQITSKFHQNNVISFLDKSICDAEKSSARVSSVKESFDALKVQWNCEISSDGPCFCLYWLIESFKRIMQLKETNVEHIVTFFTRLILEQLYLIEVGGEALFLIASILMDTVSEFHSADFMKPFISSLNIVKISTVNGEGIVHSLSTDNQKRSSGLLRKLKDYKNLDLSNLINQYSTTEILQVASKMDLNLSPEVIHEIVSALCIYHPAHLPCEKSKLNPAIIHFLPLSYLFEYCIHISDVNDVLSIVRDLLETRMLRSMFRHATLYLTRSAKTSDTIKVNRCGSVFISIIERAIKLNCLEEIISSKPYQILLLNAFKDDVYLKLLEKDVFTISILGIVSELFKVGNNLVNHSLIGILSIIKDSFVQNVGSSFPTCADVEILKIFKNVQNTEILLELLDTAYSKLDFEHFCWILDNILVKNDLGSVSGRYFSLIIQQCIAAPFEKCFSILEKILSNSKVDVNIDSIILHSTSNNLFGTNIVILDESLAEQFIPILAHNISPKLENTVRYFVKYYPRRWKIFLKRIIEEKLDGDELVLVVECFMRVCCTLDKSYNWKCFVEEEVKSALNILWGRIQEKVLTEMKESLYGRKEYQKGIFFIGKACISLFGVSSRFLEEILVGIPTMSCNKGTLNILLDVLPLLRALGGSSNSKSMILAIILRILRGYLIFMKGGEEIIDLKVIVNEIVALSNDIRSSDQVYNDVDENDMIKYISNFVITVLKSYFENHSLAYCITSLWSTSVVSKANVLTGEKLLDMVITHSKFQDLMASQDSKYGNVQFQFAQLIRTIMETNPAQFCTVKYLEKLVPIYNGTMKASDRILLSIFALYETRLGISALSWIQNDWTNKGNGDILQSFDASKMIQTLTDFPVEQNMEDILNEDFKVPCYDDNIYHLYDISFLIPFAASLLFDPGNTVDLNLFIKSNLLGIIIMGLSSTTEQTRRGSSSILVKFYELLNSSDLKERIFVIILLDSLKNAIICDTKIPPRIPSMITYFVAQASNVLINSESLLYPLVNRFLLQRPILDLKDIPMFYERIYSSSEYHRYERVWLLKLLSCGMMNDDDYHILKRRHTIDILFGLYYSSICDSQMKLMILEILFKASQQYGIAKSVMLRSSILTFFHSVCAKADFLALEESTLCIPSILASYAKLCLQFEESKSNYSTSCFSSIISTMSFYLRLLIDAFPHIKNKRMGYGALSHVLNLYVELFTESKNMSILGTHDIMNIISVVDLYEQGEVEDLIPKKSLTPSRIHIEKILPTEYWGTKSILKSLTAKWIFSAAPTSLKNRYFMDILSWLVDISVQNSTLHEGFGKWIISCRLSDQNHSFRDIHKRKEWGSFMKNLFVICDSSDEMLLSIYSSLIMLIMRDLGCSDTNILELSSKVPPPRQILLQSFSADHSKIELIFDQLRKIVWKSSFMLRDD